MPDASPTPAAQTPHFYLVGGGIASLAAAAFLIRDGDVPGHAITIIEELDRLGGSLDGAGTPSAGYVLRGGRMLEAEYRCTFALYDSIPTLDGGRSVSEEIHDWNRVMQTVSKSRLMRAGRAIDAPEFGLREHHIATLARLVIEPEAMLGRSTIADAFDAEFFRTNFWLMWCTTFAFQPWHSAVEFARYLARFAHMVSGFNQLRGILRTVYNQYDSLVRPLQSWLEQRGVEMLTGAHVTELVLKQDVYDERVAGLRCVRGGQERMIQVGPGDSVIATLGSMTDGSSLGGMDAAAPMGGATPAGASALWQKLAAGRVEFGRPENFFSDAARSKWLSFTTTLHEPALFDLVRDLTGNVPGEGGLITFPDSPWLASIVLPHQPHFIGQPEGVQVLWGYGLTLDRPGSFVAKPMQDCTGREIMTEILGHLGASARASELLGTATCIPCIMPFITSQFMPRERGDRPEIRPMGWRNLALVGQFVELPQDVVFTVEYSIRSAQVAAYALLGLDRAPPAVHQGKYDPRVLFRALTALQA